MATTVTTAQRQLILSLLNTKAKGEDTKYLQQLLSRIKNGQSVEFSDTLVLDAETAWGIIAAWAGSDEIGLPVGDRGPSYARARSLLRYLEVKAENIVAGGTKAATNYPYMQEQAAHPLIPATKYVPDARSAALQKSLELRRKTLEILNRKFLGEMTSELEMNKALAGLSPRDRSLVAAILAANSYNLRDTSPQALEDLPSKISNLLLPHANQGDINSFTHRLHADAMEKDLAQITTTINARIKATYADESEYLADMGRLRALASFAPTLADLDTMVRSILPDAPINERRALVSSLRKAIVTAAATDPRSGNDIIQEALDSAGFRSPTLEARLGTLSPYVEEMQASALERLTGTRLQDTNQREMATARLAALAGVSTEIPWTDKTTLDALAANILAEYHTNNPLLAYQQELGKGDAADLGKLGNLAQLINTQESYGLYHSQIDGNPFYAAREFFDKLTGNLNATRRPTQPIDKFRAKVYSAYLKVDKVIHWPTSTWFALQDRYPILNPSKFIYDGWINMQKGIALRVFKWSTALGKKNKWYSGFFQQVSQYSKLFYRNDASWHQANFLFLEKKWGNILDWTARGAGFESWGVFKKTTWKAVSKVIASAGNKFAAGLGDKVVKIIGAATSEAGIGLILLGVQVLWEVGKSVIGKISKFLGTIFHGDASNLWGVVPLFIASIFALFAGITVPLMAAWETLRALGKLVWDFLVITFYTALLIAVGAIAVVSIFFYSLKVTTPLDSGTSYIAAVVCNATQGAQTQTTGSPAANAAACIASYLTQFNLNPLTKDMVGNSWWQKLVAVLAKAAANALEASAIGTGHLQCVGFVAATAGLAYNQNFPQINACSYVNNAPSGYKYISGTAGMRPGDFFVMGSSSCSDGSPGHIGVDCGDAGALITACDANYSAPGIARTNGKFEKAQITGYLRKD